MAYMLSAGWLFAIGLVSMTATNALQASDEETILQRQRNILRFIVGGLQREIREAAPFRKGTTAKTQRHSCVGSS
ncbi:hypothetical protein F5X98DRAFT_346008 [Xylaria grammica]|nr:hypothetical protein F5X98DRAFT_346008 [Xylaria grammica]